MEFWRNTNKEILEVFFERTPGKESLKRKIMKVSLEESSKESLSPFEYPGVIHEILRELWKNPVEFHDAIPGEIFEGIIDGIPWEIPKGGNVGNLGEIPEGVLKWIPKEVLEGGSKEVPREVSKAILDGIFEKIPRRVIQVISRAIPKEYRDTFVKK